MEVENKILEIKPQYCTFEICKKLKELDFNIACNKYYELALNDSFNEEDGYTGSFGWKKGELNLQSDYFINNSKMDLTNSSWFLCAAPEQWLVLEWFRLYHHIWISCYIKNNKYRFKIHNYYGDILKKSNVDYNNPQEVYNDAIDYILYNLI